MEYCRVGQERKRGVKFFRSKNKETSEIECTLLTFPLLLKREKVERESCAVYIFEKK